MVHILGLPRPARPAAGPWTVYVVEPHGNARSSPTRGCPTDSTPAAWAMDVEPEYPAEDRQQLLLFGGSGDSASIDVGSHAFAWRLPGVIAGALTAASSTC